MPQPPILERIDWKAVYESGIEFDAWLDGAENADHRQAMQEQHQAQTLTPQEEGFLKGLGKPVYVVAIAEDWCGDVVRHVPVMQKLADAAPKLHVRYITREQHKNVFVRFLTNGGEAIPKFIFLSDAYVECGHWGPMPADGRELIARGKACDDVKTAREKVAGLYNADPDKRIVVRELLHCIDIAASPMA